MCLPFKRANKIHGLLFVTNFHVPILVSFNPASTTNASLGPFEASEVHYSPRYIFFLINCIETRGVVGHLPPTLWKVGGGSGGHILFFSKHFISNWIFSIKENNVKLTSDLKPFFFFFFFVLFVFMFVYFIVLVRFSSFLLPVHTKSSALHFPIHF
jgi:hypothetical protein